MGQTASGSILVTSNPFLPFFNRFDDGFILVNADVEDGSSEPGRVLWEASRVKEFGHSSREFVIVCCGSGVRGGGAYGDGRPIQPGDGARATFFCVGGSRAAGSLAAMDAVGNVSSCAVEMELDKLSWRRLLVLALDKPLHLSLVCPGGVRHPEGERVLN